jgi:hypothetical protein
MWGNGGGSPLVFDLVTRLGVTGQLHAWATLPKGIEPVGPIE